MSVADPTPEEVSTAGRSNVDSSTLGYVRVAVVFAIAIGVALAMWATTRTLLAEWSDTDNLTYTHGYLILAVCVWAIVRVRARLAILPFSPRPVLAIALALLSLLWLISYQAGLLVVHQALLPIAIWMAVCTICGWPIARECAFGIAYLYFAVPVWSLLNSALQGATTAAMKAMLPIFGVPTYFAGNTVYIPSGVFEIAGGCSGLHFFIVALAVAALYGEMNRDTFKTRVLLLIAAGVLSILANWIRVFTIIVAGHLTEMQSFLIQVDHYYFGWVVFAIAMIVFFYGASRIPQPAAEPEGNLQESAVTPGRRIWLAIALAAFAVGLGPARAVQARSSLSAAVIELPEMTGEWSGPRAPAGDWYPKFSQADALLQGTYGESDRAVELFVGVYQDQRQGKELGSAGNSVLGDTFKERKPRRAIYDRFGERIAQDMEGNEWVVWDRYQIGSRAFYSATMGQIWYGITSVRAVSPSAVIAVRSKCEPDCETARQTNEEFLRTSRIAERIAR